MSKDPKPKDTSKEDEPLPEVLRVFLQVMNELYKVDPAAAHALTCNRVPCKQEIFQHPYLIASRIGVLSHLTRDAGVDLLTVVNSALLPLTGHGIIPKFVVHEGVEDPQPMFAGFDVRKAQTQPAKE